MSVHSVEIDTVAEDQAIPMSSFSAPSWLTGEFLEKHCQNHHNNTKLKVIDFTLEPPNNYGNFVSTIYRVSVTFDAASTNELQSKNHVSFKFKVMI